MPRLPIIRISLVIILSMSLSPSPCQGNSSLTIQTEHVGEILPLSEISLHPYTKTYAFETADPFQIWSSDGSYTINAKGLTHVPDKGNCFRIDLTLNTASYVYLRIPTAIAAMGELVLSGTVRLSAASATTSGSATLGANITLPPSKRSGIYFIEKLKFPTIDWISQTTDLIFASKQRAARLFATYFPQTSYQDAGIKIDGILLMLSGTPGDRLTVFADDITLAGRLVDLMTYETRALEVFEGYSDAINRTIRQLNQKIYFLDPNQFDAYGQAFIASAKENLIQLNQTLMRFHIPTAEEFQKLKRDAFLADFLEPLSSVLRQRPFTVYPIAPITPVPILPETYPIPAHAGHTIALEACPNEYEPTALVIRSRWELKGVQMTVTDLQGPDGARISSENVDLRYVKCWYQAGSGTIFQTGERMLVPELLLKDPTLVRVDRDRRTNFLKLNTPSGMTEIDIGAPDTKFPADADFADTLSLQPVDLPKDRNQQVWITIRVPAITLPGFYQGTLEVNAPDQFSETITLKLRVLPLTLMPPAMDYAIYYTGKLTNSIEETIDAKWKTKDQYRLELTNLRSHGISALTLYQSLYEKGERLVDEALEMRKQAGFDTKALYVLDHTHGIPLPGEDNTFDPEVLNTFLTRIDNWIATSERNGFDSLYFYGNDEADDQMLLAQLPAWQRIIDAGAHVFATGTEKTHDLVGPYLDLPILYGTYSPLLVQKWHQLGKKVYAYGNPQAGIEDPELYRRNYGFALFHAGYDGCMAFAYQYGFGQIWNDFDDAKYRDHVFAYPTANGVIDTLQWEGFREAVDDMRYLTTFLDLFAIDSALARDFIEACLASDLTMAEIRALIVSLFIEAP